MFRTVSLSIISNLALYTQQYIQVMLTARCQHNLYDIYPRAIVRSKEFYVNENPTDASWDRTCHLPICSTAP